MPLYRIEVPGGGTYRVESETDLTDAQVWQAVQGQISAEAPRPKGERTIGQAFGDVGASALGGVGSLIQLPGQLAQLAGATGPSTTIEAGERLQKFAESLKSPELVAREQERKRKVEEAAKTGQLSAFGTAFGETVKDPALLLSFLAEQAPQLLVPFAAGRVGVAGARALGAGAQAAGKAGVGAAVGAGAVQQGADVGADAYVDIAKELQSKGATEQEAAEGALRLARQAGASASVISLLTQMLPGARIAERVLAGVPARAPGVGRLATAGKAALGETISEVPEEVGGKIAANIAMQQVKPEQDIFAGTGEAAAMAAIGATGLGGAVGAMGRPQPPATPAQPLAPEVAPPVAEAPAGPTPIQQRIDETTGVAAAPAPFEPLSTAEVREQKLQAAQVRAEEDMAAQEERARREGPRPQVPQPPIEDKGRLYEQMPQATPRAELEAKQAEIDKLRLDAGLPTSKGVMPETAKPEFPTEPKIVDNRPLEERAAKNRLLVMQNMLKNQGGDPNSLSIVPHPTARDRFAIQSLDRPVRLQKDLPATAITRPETPVVIDPIDAYIDIARRTNTPAAQRLVKDFESGIVTREDIGLAVEAERRAGQPLPLNYKGNGEPWFLAPEERKPRGERELPPGAKLTREPPEGPERPREGPPKPEMPETPPEKPGEEPPPPTSEMPQTLGEFKQRMPVDADLPAIRTANEAGNFRQLAETMATSKNPVIKRVGQLALPVADKIMLKKPVAPGKLGGGAVGIYRYADDSIQMDTRYAGSEWVNAHETVHALVARAQRSPSPKQAPYVRQIEDLYKYAKKELGRRGYNSKNTYGLTNEREFVSEAMSNAEFQYLLMQVPYKGRRSAWTEFVRIVADMLGIKNTNALTEVLNLVDKLAQVKRPIRTPFDRKEVEATEALELPKLSKEEPTPERKPTGQQALDIVASTGMQAKPPEPSAKDKIKTALLAAKEDPKLAASSARKAVQDFIDKIETMAFSGDAKFNNDIRRALIADFKDNPEVLGLLLEASQSQAVHSDALATQFITEGGIAYDEDTKKWVAVKKDDNFIKLAQEIEALGKAHGLTKQEAERVAHTYFVAKRFKSLAEKQDQRAADIARLEAEANREQDPVRRKGLRSEIDKLQKAEVFITDEQRAMIEPGLRLGEVMPELKDISDTWQAIRVNAIKAMVDGQLWSYETAERMLDNIDYVPFYREEQLEEGGGPVEFLKGLQVKADEYRLKGSQSPVNDVFDNMVRWTQYAINRSVRNHKALQMIDLGKEIKVGDDKMVKQVEKKEKGANVVRVFRDGVQELYEVADPLYMEAFSSISNVAIPSLRFFSWMSNLLRQSVVLYPLFSVAQVPQDAFAAMFTSGLKPQYALRIPALAVKEFVKTLRKTSATHNMLKKYGAVGVRDFSAAVARQDVEIAAGLKAPKGVTGKVIESLSHIAMSADNAVRQAVYEASMAQGLSKAEAIEKAFDLINFRRRGTSKFINLMGQTVPFFYAYMSVQRTALKTLSLVGISPTTRGEALKTLGYTTAAVMALSLLYTMANAGDDEYEKTPTAIRDRTLHIPGTSARIPLRPDFFLLPKIVTEHMYHLITDNGLTDGAKFRKTMRDTVWNAVASPQPIPQAAKPLLEVAINYDFFQGRPIVGPFEQKKEAERQFNDNTSELSKILGSAGGVSPEKLDHVIRGMFGSVGGLVLYATNMAISPVGDVPRPDKSFQDALASIPGTSGFVTKTTESRLKNDFYELRDEVVKANETYKDIKNRTPQELEAFISDEKNMIRLGLVSTVEEVTRQLSNIRKAIGQATNAPADVMSAADKRDYIEQLRDMEKQLMEGIDVPGLRKMAQM